MDAQAYGQVHSPLARLCRRRAQPFLLQVGIELPQGFEYPEPGSYRPLRIIFVGLGIAEVDEQTIAEILRDMPVKAGDHLGAGVLIGPHHLAQVFGVKLCRERGRTDQVTEEHGELAPFRRWRGEDSRGRCRLGERRRLADPDQDSPVLVHGKLFGIDKILLEIFEQVVIEVQPAFEHAVGEALLLLEQREDLDEDRLIVHHGPSTCAKAASA